MASSSRGDWTFQFPTSAVLDGARKRLAYHVERWEFWTAQHAESEKTLKEKGVEVREHAVSGGYDQRVTVDQEMARRVSECKTKVQEHKACVDGYSTWVTCLQQETVKSLSLTQADVVYFRLDLVAMPAEIKPAAGGQP